MALCATRGRWGLGLLGLVGLPMAAQPAGAAQDCGPPAMNAVTCTAPVMGQSFTDADGITYDAGGASLTVTVNAALTAEHVTVTGSNANAALSIDNAGSIVQTATSAGATVAGLHAAVPVGGTGSVTILNSGNISIGEAQVDGIFGDVGNGPLTIQSSGDITVPGSASGHGHGIFARSIGGAIDLTVGGSIDGALDSVPILVFTQTGTVDITTSAVITGDAAGVRARAFGVGDITFDMTGGSITTNGSSTAVQLDTLGQVTMTLDGAIATQGSGVAVTGAAGIDATLSGSVTAPFGRAITLNAANSTLTFAITAGGFVSAGLDQPAVALDGSLVSFDNAGEVTADRLFLASSGPTTLRNDGTLRGSASFDSGDALFENRAGGLVDWGGAGAETMTFNGAADRFDNQTGGTLALRSRSAGGDLFQMAGLESFRSAGRVTLADLETGGMTADPGDVLQISGNFISAGGTLALDVTLGGDGSAADLLRVGSTSLAGGPTLVEIVNAGGLGAETVNGIRVVDVTGASAAGAFVLAAPVTVGPYEYFLVRGDDGDWYLTTTGAVPPTPLQAFQGSALLLAWQQGLRPLDERLALLRVAQGQAQSAALGLADHQLADAFGAPRGGPQSGLWLRASGGFGNYDGSTGEAFDQQGTVLQAGYDVGFAGALGGDWLFVGVAASLTESTAEAGQTELDLTGYGGALYATWLSGPLYLDLVAKADSFRATQQAAGRESEATGWMAGASLEAGYSLLLGGGLLLQPQAQITYARGDLGALDDTIGRAVDFDEIESLSTRAGLLLGASLPLGGGVVLQPSLSADWIHEFAGDSGASFGALRAESDLGGSRWRFGAGLAVIDGGGDFQLLLNGDYETGESGEAVQIGATLRLPL